MEQRANIKFSFKPGKKFAETYELLEKVYCDDCMSRTQVYTWFTLIYHRVTTFCSQN